MDGLVERAGVKDGAGGDCARRSFLHTLRCRVILLVLLAVIPAIVLTGVSAWEQRVLATRLAHEEAMRLARVAAIGQDRAAEGARQLLIALSQVPEVLGDDMEACSALLARLKAQYKFYLNLGVIDADGDIIASALPFEGRVDASWRTYFQRAVTTRDFAVGDHQIGTITRRPSVNFGYPILDDLGNVRRVVFAAMDLGWLNDLAVDAGLPPGATLTAIDRTGIVLAQYPDAARWVGRNVRDAEFVQVILERGGEGLAELKGLDGVRRLFSFAPLGSAEGSGYVAVGIPSRLAYAAVQTQLVRNLLLLGLATVLAVFAASCGCSTFVLRRLDRLVSAANRMSRGDLTARSGVPHSLGEIGNLARAFDDMASALALREAQSRRDRDALRSAHAELEARVEERTSELAQANEELRLKRAEAEAASRAKGEFLAHMSHEVRTPLNGVIGMTDLLLGTTLTPLQRRYASLAKSSAQSLTSIVNDILDFSKIEAGKLDLANLEFDLHLTVEDVMQLLGPAGQNKGLELVSHVHPDVPRRARGDPDRIRQILINLVGNAVKFTSRGSIVLRVVLDEEDADACTVRFSVTDTGVGIAPGRVDRLFRSFSQVDASTTRQFGGTGLGLAICKRLATLMGGRIGVESEPGRGSTFWFTARLARCPHPRTASHAAPDPRGLRVLAVDDSEVQREVIGAQIRSLGFEMDAAPDGEAALAALTHAAAAGAPFRIAIVDRDLPGLDGFELGMAIRATPGIDETVLMILISLDENVDPNRLRALGFAAHMTKPVRQSQLFDTIMNAIAREDSRASGAPPISPERSASRTHAAHACSGRVLLAEDNEVNQIVASETLRRAGFECEVVADGRAGVDALARGGFDVVLMDCQMPVMDGFEAAREIRRRETEEATKRVPIIALTANAMKGDRERCLEAGMDGYCSKPVDPERLIEAIRDVTSARESRPGADRPVSAPTVASTDRADWCEGNRDLYDRVLATFERELHDDLERMERPLRDADPAAARTAAHALKGAAALVRAEGVARAARLVEEAGDEGSLDRIRRAVDELRGEIERCLEDLPRLRAGAAGEVSP